MVQQLKEDKWLDDRQYANLMRPTFSVAIGGLPYYNKKILQKGIPKIYPTRNAQTMISPGSDRPYHNKTRKKIPRKYPLKAIETKIIQGLISKALHTAKRR